MSAEHMDGSSGLTEDLVYRLTGSNALAKASIDPFDYACGLRSGAVIYFESVAAVNKEWVTLTGVRAVANIGERDDFTGPPNFERGVEVRLDRIEWVADAPYGS